MLDIAEMKLLLSLLGLHYTHQLIKILNKYIMT